MRHAYTWAAIAFIVIASVTGDVLLARAMKQVGLVKLDEPFAGVDPISVGEIQKIVRHLKARGYEVTYVRNVTDTEGDTFSGRKHLRFWMGSIGLVLR